MNIFILALNIRAVVPEKVVELIKKIKQKKYLEAKLIDKKLLVLAKNIYGKYPHNFATARIKYCLKILKKIPNEIMKSSIILDNNEKKQLKKSLKFLGLKF
jgi:dihydrodipicolinate synthase/N-acetylneuraminate lyase